jgi:hypothetical protein
MSHQFSFDSVKKIGIKYCLSQHFFGVKKKKNYAVLNNILFID